MYGNPPYEPGDPRAKYDGDANGTCGNGHAVNGYGRCRELDEVTDCQPLTPAQPA